MVRYISRCARKLVLDHAGRREKRLLVCFYRTKDDSRTTGSRGESEGGGEPDWREQKREGEVDDEVVGFREGETTAGIDSVGTRGGE